MNPHIKQPIAYSGAPITPDNPVIVALHGRNQDTDFIINVCERLNWTAASIVAPPAEANTWYPTGFMAPFDDNEPKFTYALERVQTLLDDLREQGVPQEHIVLLGFSQGACLAAEYAIRNPGRYGGIVIYTGGVIGPPGTRWDYAGDFENTPTLVTTGDTDAWVPVGRVHETIALFRERGAPDRKSVV